MKIAVVCRVYNESSMIHDFLDHYRRIATGGFYFYDDGSTDGTVSILENESNVKHVIKGKRLPIVESHDQQNPQRKQIMDVALNDLTENDYILLLDADEFIEFTVLPFEITNDLVHFHLFDSYITEKDKDDPWQSREMFGPELRDIAFMVRVGAYKTIINDRTILIKTHQPINFGGFVRHVGKSISVEYWENKCKHYSTSNMPRIYRDKWELRKGKAIHTLSDFNRPLYKWDDLIKNPVNWVKI